MITAILVLDQIEEERKNYRMITAILVLDQIEEKGKKFRKITAITEDQKENLK